MQIKLPADITPSAPVYCKQSSTSLKDKIFPLAITGMFTLALISLMTSHDANPVACPFCSRVLPCTARTEQPESSSILNLITGV